MITKTDVVGQIIRCQGQSCATPASLVMTREVVVCKPDQLLSDVWSIMKMRELRNIPVVNAGSHPIGMLTARDALELLLEEAQDEELLLRDYVMCVGYHRFRSERPKHCSQPWIGPPTAPVALESDCIPRSMAAMKSRSSSVCGSPTGRRFLVRRVSSASPIQLMVLTRPVFIQPQKCIQVSI